ncbi:hypothetical protein [Streptomyces sp. MP131-18]|uniref:hypothetical protein n=1 Tax=Streptomyces sp. MP131-18 TaxID=1857892 RepID=UPI00097C3788|nr:hypothetical protein [Streptomyces sp. MP131-18]ONK14080.1 hypothetical protein STBA_48590 [Streptomyces sp. MP131-18]
MNDEPLLAELRARNERLTGLEREHLRRSGGGDLLIALGSVLAASLVVLPLVSAPLTELSRYGGLLLPGVPVSCGALYAGWLGLRRLHPAHGPVGEAYRAAAAERTAVLDQLYALPAAPGDAAGGDAAAEERERARIEQLFTASSAAGEVPGLHTTGDVARHMYGAPFRTFRWSAAMGVLGIVLVLTALITLMLPLVAGEVWPVVLVGIPLVGGWCVCFRFCAQKWRSGDEGRVSRTQKAGWRAELAYLRHRLSRDAGVPPWRVPALHTQRTWQLTGGGRRSPAEVLRTLPPDAPWVRRAYWRWVGPGAVRIVALFAIAFGVVAAMRLVG